ncbi:CoA-disulfide reductase [Alkalicoccus saliphilus]|uniref:CoA-disulfide reductase n=2 Tax=Alkalicoccus saliphilus TaxID=200989 RepID=A0A2T4U746_9BACI|nr:CoA-disulfide reductase [Alkalicoccus saliphilus]
MFNNSQIGGVFMKVIVVGGVAGGATAAARLRRISEKTEIVVFERGKYVSFANCGLPYYIGGEIKEREKLLVQTVEGMSKRFAMDIRNETEVTSINRNTKTVTAVHLPTGKEYTESYDKLLLSPGARPVIPPIPGLKESENLFTLRNIPDTDQINGWIEERKPAQAVIVGGGFIGLEMAENLYACGMDVTIVEMADQIMAPLDKEMASIVENRVRDFAELYLNDGVKEFRQKGNKIILSSGKELSSDLTILSIGVTPENKLAEQAGLALGERGGIIVDEYLQTDDPYIYAVGDAVETIDYILQKPVVVPLAWPANRQGRIVADTISGKPAAYPGTLGTAIAKVFDLTAASAGKNEKQLREAGINYKAVHIHPLSHAGYYPGAEQISMKLLFDPGQGTILGVQAVGKEGVDKRVDVISTAIRGNLTVFDLQEIELSYAPPYSSAKDPVNMLGYAASHVAEEEIDVVHAWEINKRIEAGEMLVDVRTPEEFKKGSVPGAVNIDLDSLRERLADFPKDKPVNITCQVGLRGYIAVRILKENGIEARNLSGGYKTYSELFRSQEMNALFI